MSDDCDCKSSSIFLMLFSFGTGGIFGYVSDKLYRKYFKKNCSTSTSTETSYENFNDK